VVKVGGLDARGMAAGILAATGVLVEPQLLRGGVVLQDCGLEVDSISMGVEAIAGEVTSQVGKGLVAEVRSAFPASLGAGTTSVSIGVEEVSF